MAAAAALVFAWRLTTGGVSTPRQVASVQVTVATLSSRRLQGFTHGALTAGAFWVTSPDQLVRFDTKTNREVAVAKVGDERRDPGQADPFDVVSGDGQLWATDRADRAVVRIDPTT